MQNMDSFRSSVPGEDPHPRIAPRGAHIPHPPLIDVVEAGDGVLVAVGNTGHHLQPDGGDHGELVAERLGDVVTVRVPRGHVTEHVRLEVADGGVLVVGVAVLDDVGHLHRG